MKRELVAIAFLILMLGFLFGNLRFLGDLVEEVEGALGRSAAAWERGDRQLAVSEMETAMEAWHSAAEYAHIMLRQGEIDAVSDAFFDLSAALREGEGKSTEAYLRLFYHLDSIERMDALRLSSIF